MRVFDAIAHSSDWRDRGDGGKATLCLGLILAAIGGPEPYTAPLALGSAALLALGSARVPPAAFLGVLMTSAGFLATGLPVLAVTVSWNGGPVLSWSSDATLTALKLGMRSLAAVSAMALLILTTPPGRLIGLLPRTGLSGVVADLAMLVYRLLFLVGDTAATGYRAQSFRLGYHGWRRSMRSLSLLISGLLTIALTRARRMETGLAARGYRGSLPVLPGRPRTSMSEWIMALGLPSLLMLAGWGLKWGN
ncbi:MAG: cobalt ECF transporter T component CbiQ [Magnetococcales bacterium]|nr:cobalt ECF transporter T component CbiQ [Magnetococcales bacterium]